jgi:UDP-GlcNAc:undecaprenyl-phosphate/decaprenyl-phosphate GlcNAc-1-phosphate transferase
MLENISFIIVGSLFAFFVFNKLSYNLNLLDYPNIRKLHKKPTPLVGGIGICVTLILSIFLLDFKNYIFNDILSLSIIIVIGGIFDDLKNLNAKNKILFQAFAISILILKNDFVVSDIGFYPKIGLLELGSLSYIFTLLCIILFINASNYLDGLDGTLSLVFLTSISLLYLNTSNINADLNYFYISITIPVIIFLCFNLMSVFPKIFLGDSGSQLLGYLLACLMVLTYKNYEVHPIVIAWCVNLIIYDFLYINFYRIKNKINILSASKDHLHHSCYNYTKSIFKSNVIIVLLHIFLASIGILIFEYGNSLLSLAAYILFFLGYCSLRLNSKF